MNIGLQELKRQLEELGLKVSILNDQFVNFFYRIPHGKFRGNDIEIALEAPQFPLVPPSGLYIKPLIMPFTGGGGVHPHGGIHQRNIPTPEYQYWSRPFANWDLSSKNAKTYMAFIRTVFDI